MKKRRQGRREEGEENKKKRMNDETPSPLALSTERYYPDMQPQLCVMLALAQGVSTVRETVFENRFSHVAELAKMGCDARVAPWAETPRAVIKGTGGSPLTGADVRGSDLRASAALVLAGLAAEGVTRVEGLRHLDRGYEGLDDKLIGLGAVIRRHPM